MQEGRDAIKVIVERNTSLFEVAEVEYYVTPKGDAQFYGGIGVLLFQINQSLASSYAMAIDDDIPEVRMTHNFFLNLCLFYI